MFELPSAQFTRVLPLFDPDQPNSTMLFSTLEGRTPGKVYVDDVDHPTAGILVINFYNTTFLGGALDPFWVQQALSELRQNQDILLTWSPRLAVSLEPPALEIGRYEFYDRIPGPRCLFLPATTCAQSMKYSSHAAFGTTRRCWRSARRKTTWPTEAGCA